MNTKKNREWLSEEWFNSDGFMTYETLIGRLRVDLEDPNFFAFDLYVPRDEAEYQGLLDDMKKIHQMLINHKNDAPAIYIDGQKASSEDMKNALR